MLVRGFLLSKVACCRQHGFLHIHWDWLNVQRGFRIILAFLEFAKFARLHYSCIFLAFFLHFSCIFLVFSVVFWIPTWVSCILGFVRCDRNVDSCILSFPLLTPNDGSCIVTFFSSEANQKMQETYKNNARIIRE